MNSRERVRIALEHKEPDRVHIDFGGSFLISATTLEVWHEFISPDSVTEDLVGVWAMQKPWDLDEDAVLDTGETTMTYQQYNTVSWETTFARGATDRGAVLATDSITGGSELGVWSIPAFIIQGWLNNPSTNYGFQLDGYLNTLRETFFSKNQIDPTRIIPKLIVTYESPTTTSVESSWYLYQ